MTINKTLAETLQVRTQKHNEATAFLSSIQIAQNAITEHQQQLSKIDKAASFYGPVSQYHIQQIEKQTELRNYAINQYERLMYLIYSASLPIFSSTSVQEVSLTLYSGDAAHA